MGIQFEVSPALLGSLPGGHPALPGGPGESSTGDGASGGEATV